MGIKLTGRELGKIVRAAAVYSNDEVQACWSEKKAGARYICWYVDNGKNIASLVNQILRKRGIDGVVRNTRRRYVRATLEA